MQRDSALATVAVLMTMALASPDARAQMSTGQIYYLNGLPGVPSSDCARAGCHANNPLTEPTRVMKAACTTIPIYGSPDAGMQAVIGLYDDTQLQAIANWLCTLVTPPPPPPPPPPPGVPPPPPPPPPPGEPPPPPPRKPLIEFFHADFGHYFITNVDAEINGIDTGVFKGWQRTGRSFGAYASNNGFQTPVCRFFTEAFAPKSSHFYTASSVECFGVKGNKDWQYEGEAFWVQPVDAGGGCPAGFTAVYRLYNNGQTGAPNHRYTVDLALYAEFSGKNWFPEGIQFCAPN